MSTSVIHLLDEETVSHIAAGEVVERPASVVKELVENSIDAGATRIRVLIKSDGSAVSRITVIDDGKGMSPEDARLAFRQHATSKISNLDDLADIRTLGFRGEALASIAAVSEIILSTRRSDEIAGTRLELSGGVITDESACGTPPGTTIEVSSLFFNTPARRKFLRTISTELAHLFDTMERTALSHPEISFQLVHQEKEKFRTSGRGDLRGVILELFGMEIAGSLISLTPMRGEVEVNGYVADPLISRRSRSQIYISVNGRQISSPALVRAIRDGFGVSIPKDEYPFAVIDCRIDPAEIDVNVHPTKREVRFSSERRVFNSVRTTIWSAITNITPPKPPIETTTAARLPIVREAEEKRPLPVSIISDTIPPYKTDRQLRQTELAIPLMGDPPCEVTPHKTTVFGQMYGTYIIAAGEEGELLIIDQHAAHEKIVYDRLVQRMGGKIESQHLLIPITIQLTRKDAVLLHDAEEDLISAGFEIEEFGVDTFAVRAVPAGGKQVDDPEEVRSLILELIEGIRGPAGERRMRIYKTIACKTAIKGNTLLSPEQMERLLSQLFQAGPPYTCPHGRPAFIRFTEEDLAHRFRRR
jgi:DNA mismatch repair protein MutL